MIEIEMPDGTILEFPDGTASDVMQQAAQSYMGQGRGIGETLYQNIIGDDVIDTPGERAGDYIKSGFAATGRGIADAAGFAGDILRGAADVGTYLAGAEEDQSLMGKALRALPIGSPEMRAGMSAATMGASEHRTPGTVGDFISTAGEFAGSAGLLGGPKAMLKYGAIPGAASEGAGQLTEGTAMEPYARAVTALAAPLVTGGATRMVRRAITPNPDIPSAQQASAQYLESRGIPLTAGQKTGNKQLLKQESMAPQMDALRDAQLEKFTKQVMKSVDVDGLATPENMTKAYNAIGKKFERGMTAIRATSPNVTRLKQTQAQYALSKPKVQREPIFDNIVQQLEKSAATGEAVGAKTVKDWRQVLSKLTASRDRLTADAAIEFVDVLDGVIARELRAAGRTQELSALLKARKQYRDLLAITRAQKMAGPEAASGLITPERLRSSIAMQGARSYVTGGRPMGELGRHGTVAMGMPKTSGTPEGIAAILKNTLGPGVGMGGTGAAVGGLLGGPTGAMVGAGAGAAIPWARKAAMMSGPGQKWLANQMVGAGPNILDPRYLATIGATATQGGPQ